MPVVSINFGHKQYEHIVKGAMENTKCNLSEFVKKFGLPRENELIEN